MDIKNTKEILVAANEIGLVVAQALKDGAQMSDVMVVVGKIMGDLQGKVGAAISGASEAPAEIKDISVNEVVELVALQLEYVPKFVNVLK